MKKLLLLALLAVGCQKEDIKPIEEKIPNPQLYTITWFDHWNMDLAERRYVDLGKLKEYPDSIDVIIIADNGTEHNILNGGGYYWNDGKLWLWRHDWFDNPYFDNTDFNDGYMNRGYIIIYN